MIQRRRPISDANPASELTESVKYVLWLGWGGKPPDETERVGNSDGIFELAGGWGIAAARNGEPDDSQFEPQQRYDVPVIRLWRRHEAYLLSEAARLGIAPPFEADDGRRLFYGQLAALPYAEQSNFWRNESEEV